jgi:flagellum-specific peptidoglycan hydrolase FlgJ
MLQAEFVQMMYPYAVEASKKLNVNVEIILAQWALESGWGASQAFLNQHNAAGIEKKSGPLASFASWDEFVLAYIQAMTNDCPAIKDGKVTPDSTPFEIFAGTDYNPYANYAQNVNAVWEDNIKKIFASLGLPSSLSSSSTPSDNDTPDNDASMEKAITTLQEDVQTLQTEDHQMAEEIKTLESEVPSSSSSPQQTTSSQEILLPTQNFGNLLTVEVTLQGTKATQTTAMILDSGSSTITINSLLAENLGIKNLTSSSVDTAGGTVLTQSGTLDVVLNGQTFLDVAVIVDSRLTTVPPLFGIGFFEQFGFGVSLEPAKNVIRIFKD